MNRLIQGACLRVSQHDFGALQEKAPRDIPVATVRTEADERVKGVVVEQSPDTRLVLV